MRLAGALFVVFFWAGPVAAEVGSHVHGKAMMYLVAEADRISVELESPTVDLVGFEHAPRNDAQERLLEQVAFNLSKPDHFLEFVGAQCHPLSVEVKAPYSAEVTSDNSVHSGFRASYQFKCDNLAEFNSVIVTLFERFPGIHGIAVQWISSGCQGAELLTGKDNKLQMK
ncbi:ZrgA family zinc uptake protein [Microbulbifer sp. SSSA005]|uniref:ZrgA family zinc uptake protein n=1 Tax=Microbulbifer sp. SSSA005 TaxID=3243378 RepID=UPI004039BED2